MIEHLLLTLGVAVVVSVAFLPIAYLWVRFLFWAGDKGWIP